MTSLGLYMVSLLLVCTSAMGPVDREKHQTGIQRIFTKLEKQILHAEVGANQTNLSNLNTNITHYTTISRKKCNDHREILEDKHINHYSEEMEKINEFSNYTLDVLKTNLGIHKINMENARLRREKELYLKKHNLKNKISKRDVRSEINSKRTKREDYNDGNCEKFEFSISKMKISHPAGEDNNYAKSVNCYTVINATGPSDVIRLKFVDLFHIESHPTCDYDFLEIRDGLHGYAQLLGKHCGEDFPNDILSTGPNLWLKFHSDETIEYEGFNIIVEFEPRQRSFRIPQACFMDQIGNTFGYINNSMITSDCNRGDQAIDVLWKIVTPKDTKIYLNFTKYELVNPNNCEDNVLQVFGSILEIDDSLANYCGSVANSVITKDGDPNDSRTKNVKGNELYVRLYATQASSKSVFEATYTAFRSLSSSGEEDCYDTEFKCADDTCIDNKLKCDGEANCRLKSDEDAELCKAETESIVKQPHILIILVIFSLILSGMSFVFLFKCIKKLYEDHKIIKEHIRQSTEDRLDTLLATQLTLDPKRLESDSEPRASLERENHTNEMYKQQRRFSERKATSIDSDFIQETNIDMDDEPWRRDVDSVPVEAAEVRIERNGRIKRSDTSKKEESIRSKSAKEDDEKKVKKDIKDASVGAPDVKESGCQTRESLFQSGPTPGSDSTGTESGSNSRGFSTFGYSGATIVRPSPPAPSTNTSEIKIELLRQMPSHQDSVKPQKKSQDRRPMSTETTRSAPDVIIVSKPIG